jgi:hypothetical protein
MHIMGQIEDERQMNIETCGNSTGKTRKFVGNEPNLGPKAPPPPYVAGV